MRAVRVPRALVHGHQEWHLIIVGGTIVVGTVAAFAYLSLTTPYDTWGPVFILAALSTIAAPVVLSTARKSDDPLAVRILALSFMAKMVGGFLRYYVNIFVYDESADAGVYHETGRVVAVGVWNGAWSLDNTLLQFRPPETQSIGWLVGAIYSLVGASELGGYLIFAFFGWLAMIWFYRAFRIAFPDLRSRSVLLLFFFLPSIVYWPSSPGKEATVVALLGLATLGLARMLFHQDPLRGLAYASLAVLGVMRVRPHIAMLLLVGVAVALLVRSRQEGGTSAAARLVRLALLVLLVPALFLGLGRVDHAFGDKSGEVTVSGVFDRTADQTSGGNSSFVAKPVRSPIDLPMAIVSVLFRPFTWESSGGPALIASLEGVVLIILLLTHFHVFGCIGSVVRTNPLAAFCLAYALAFIVAFSNVANAGILVRQRTQVFPFVMFLLGAAFATAEARRAEQVDPLPLQLSDDTVSLSLTPRAAR